MKDDNIYAEYLTKNKVKKTFSKVLLIVLLVGISFAAGLFLPKMIGKSNVKTVLEEEKEEEMEPSVETKVEEKTEEKTLERNEVKDDGKGAHYDVNGNPTPNRSYEFLDEKSFDITLNSVAYKIRTYYYKDNRENRDGYILKELYFGTKKIIDLVSIGKFEETNPDYTLKDFVDQNYNLDKETSKILKDTVSKDEYFAFYSYTVEVNDECTNEKINLGDECERDLKKTKGIILNKFGEVVFESKINKYFLKLPNKVDALDRTYYEDDNGFCYVYDGDGEYYENQVDTIYEKYGITYPDFYRSGIEFKDNHFYYFELVKDNDNPIVRDYKAQFSNGVFKKELLKEYPANDNHVEGCKGLCEIE